MSKTPATAGVLLANVESRVSAKSKNRFSMLLKKSGVDVRNLKFVEK